jgi:glutamyl/glutaminyl-tRNA synthetase
MPDEYDDDTDFDNEDGSQLVRDLRKQLKAIKKERDDLASVAEQFQTEQRKRSVSEALKAKGAEKYAKFYTSEDSSPEAIDAWVSENADLFGIEIPSAEDDETATAAARISQATARAPQQTLGTPNDLMNEMLAANTPAEWKAVQAKLEGVRLPS